MATNFPSSLDTFTNPSSTDAMDSVSVPHATQHSDLNDAVEALEAKVGADSSGVTSSHDYKIAQLEAGVTGGKILQVVSTTKTNNFSTSSASHVEITDLSATITPSSASSKVLVMYSVNVSQTSTSYGVNGVLRRDSTDIFIGTDGTSENVTNYVRYWSSSHDMGLLVGQYLDSPATTSSVTYKYAVLAIAGGTVYVNRRGVAGTTGLASSITVMEVSA